MASVRGLSLGARTVRHVFLTMVFYLNDDFEGGETDFTELKRKIIPRRGSVLLFQHRSFVARGLPWIPTAYPPTTRNRASAAHNAHNRSRRSGLSIRLRFLQ